MAVWQVGFRVIPHSALGTAPSPLTREAVDGLASWADVALPFDYRTRLTAVAAAAQSAVDVESWGDAEGNRVDVRSQNGRVRSVMVHVDVRRLDPKFGAALLVLVKAARAVLVRQDGLIVEPTINAYSGALRSSSAWRYASDPAAWLAAQAANDQDAEE